MKTTYVFDFTSSYIKRDVKDSDEDKEILKERKPAIIAVEIPKGMRSLHKMLSQYAEEHVRCVAESL